jgi:hypothetical protein
LAAPNEERKVRIRPEKEPLLKPFSGRGWKATKRNYDK